MAHADQVREVELPGDLDQKLIWQHRMLLRIELVLRGTLAGGPFLELEGFAIAFSFLLAAIALRVYRKANLHAAKGWSKIQITGVRIHRAKLLSLAHHDDP